MRKRRALLLGVACLVALIAVIALRSRNNEPHYKGRSLSHWVILYGDTFWKGGDKEAADAISHIGTNALPFLLEWVAYVPKPSRFRTGARAFFAHVPSAIAPERLVKWVCEDKDALRAESTVDVFDLIGPQVRLAMPELFRMMNEPGASTNDVSQRALLAMGYIHSDDPLPMYLSHLADTNAPNRGAAAFLIGRCPLITNGEPAVATLIDCLADRDPTVRPAAASALLDCSRNNWGLVVTALTNRLVSATNAAIRAGLVFVLGNVGFPSDRTILPFLVTAARDPSARVRIEAASALGKFDVEIPNTLPLLTNLLADPDSQVQKAASNAINRITASGAVRNPNR